MATASVALRQACAGVGACPRGHERDAAAGAHARDVRVRQRRQRPLQHLAQRGRRALQRLERAALALVRGRGLLRQLAPALAPHHILAASCCIALGE